jgi:hypothetical protein
MKKQSQIDEMISYYDQRASWHDQYMNYQGIDKMEKHFFPIINTISVGGRRPRLPQSYC